MHGNPMTRATSADGRWAYTLYDGNGHPFVHALDTAPATARCIDLPAVPVDGKSVERQAAARFGRPPARHAVAAHLATIDTRTLSVVESACHGRAARPRTAIWLAGGEAILAAAAAIALLAAAYGARRSIVQRAPAAAARVPQPVVKPVGPVLPELVALGREPVAAP